jgi:hypothetical protein
MTQRKQVIIPTAINMVTFINDALLTSRKASDEMSVSLPSMRDRAKLIVNGTGSLHVVVREPTLNASSFTR